jgi:protein involved in polysaccharide export with SLBB domain
MKKTACICLAGFALALLAGCKSTQPRFASVERSTPTVTNATAVTLTNQVPRELLQPTSDLFTLGPGDSVEIEILGTPNSRTTTAVGPDGKIYYHLLPGLDVWGLTLQQARELMEKQFAKYFTDPQLSLTLRGVGSKYVWLLGRLNRPGVYPLAAPTTLLESIASAGGTSRSLSQVESEELADLRHSFVVRQGQFVPVDFQRLLREGDVSQNIFLQPDDFVYVASVLAQEVYVLGAVKAPRALPYTERTTLVSAIASGAGMERYEWISAGNYDPGPFTKDAYLSHVAIVRGALSTPQISVVDYNAIVKGKAPDVRLEPGDIVFVPNSPYTTLKRYFNIILNTFVTTVAANEGIRVANGTAGVGVAVPVGGR